MKTKKIKDNFSNARISIRMNENKLLLKKYKQKTNL